MPKARIPASAFIVVLVLALAAPALARPAQDDLTKRREAAAKKAAAAVQLDTLRAEDRQLEDAVRALDANVAVQANSTAAAQQAVEAANSALGTAEAELAATELRLSQLRDQASAVAIRAYVHPGSDNLLEIMGSADLNEASRRQALMAHVVSTDRDVVDQLRAAREDQQAQQENLAALRDQASARKLAAQQRLADLERARSEKARLETAVDERIRQYTAEVDALAREEANLTNLIRAREAAGRSATGSASGGGRAASAGGSSASGFAWPVGGPVTSGFGMRWGRMHTGIDISAGYGVAVKAAKGGTVIQAGSMGGYGNLVIVDHGGGLTTLYAHLSRFNVSSGESVSTGTLVGAIGTTGNSTGPHLHFETRSGGTAQNPMNYLP